MTRFTGDQKQWLWGVVGLVIVAMLVAVSLWDQVLGPMLTDAP